MNRNLSVSDRQTRVNNWMAKKRKTDLFFINVLEDYHFDSENHRWEIRTSVIEDGEHAPLNLNEAIIWMLQKSQRFGSKTLRASRNETPPGRLRSAFDIWRHLKPFIPDITIFDVMNSLWEVREQLGSQFCTTVRKRVFWLRHSQRFNEHYGDRDEFGLHFVSGEWAGISAPEEIVEAVGE